MSADKQLTPDQLAGRHLALLRESAGLTQEALGELAGVSRTNVNHYENGRRPITLEVAGRFTPWLNLPDPSLLLPRSDLLGRLVALEAEVRRVGRNQEKMLVLLAELDAALGEIGSAVDGLRRSIAPERKRTVSR